MDAQVQERDPELEEFERQEIADHAIAEAAHWPPRLRKALSDSYYYTIKIRGEAFPWHFESASVIGPQWVRLDGVEWNHERLPRGVDVRVSSIEWVTDAQS